MELGVRLERTYGVLFTEILRQLAGVKSRIEKKRSESAVRFGLFEIQKWSAQNGGGWSCFENRVNDSKIDCFEGKVGEWA